MARRVASGGDDRIVALASSISSGVVELDPDRNVVLLNATARSMLGGTALSPPFPWPAEIAFSSSEARAGNDHGGDPVTRVIEGQAIRAEPFEIGNMESGSGAHAIRVSGQAVATGNQVSCAFLVFERIGDDPGQPNARGEYRSSDVNSKLAQGLANDFNNVLATIAYAIDLSLKQALPEKAASLLMTALSTVERGQQTTERMQGLASQTNGQTATRSVMALLEDFNVLVSARLDERITMKLACNEADLVLRCNQVQLEEALVTIVTQIADEILGRASGGDIVITARTAEASGPVSDLRARDGQDSDYVVLTVCGHASEMQSASMKSADPDLTRGSADLEKVRSFVTGAGGDMHIKAGQQDVSGISLYLPLERTVGRGLAPDEKVLPRGTGETIFLVEDEPMFLLMLQEELEDLGYRVISATSGKAALGLIEQGVEFDLVIADVVMPGDIDGFDLAAKICRMHHGAAVLYMSGYSGFQVSDMGEVEAPILKKPCHPSELAKAVKAALAKRTA